MFFWLVVGAARNDSTTASRGMQLFFDADPLIVLGTLLSAHTVAIGALLAVLTLAVTALFGRVFCGWVCPLGTLNTMMSWFRRRRIERFSKWQRAKYYLLVALLVMAVFGVHWFGVLDPISLTYRSLTFFVLPAAQYAIEDGSTAVFQSDPAIGPFHITSITEPVYGFFREQVFAVKGQAFRNALLVAGVFIGILGLNLVRRRFWCRYICPLGALLGLVARRPVLRLKPGEGACTGCRECAAVCQGAASPEKPGKWQPSECFMCWNCVPSCPEKGLAFGFGSPFKSPTKAKLDLGKRAMLASGAGGLAALLAFRLSPQAQARTYNKDLIRPPGARGEREFLQRCIQCGLCMRVCPTNGLQPTLFEAGIEGIWTPRLDPQIGYCAYECNLCGQVCPTQAIQPLSMEEKQKVKLGLASIDTSRCLPYAYGRDCIVCEEHCPLPTKAIYFIEAQVPMRDGSVKTVKQPHVDPSLCIGCGICENKCPFEDKPAIRVTSSNESRHPNAQPILPDYSEGGGYGTYGGSSDSSGGSSPYGF